MEMEAGRFASVPGVRGIIRARPGDREGVMFEVDILSREVMAVKAVGRQA